MRADSRERRSASGSLTRISSPPRSPTGFFIVRRGTIVDAPRPSRQASGAAIFRPTTVEGRMTSELDKRGRALEDAFFNKKDEELLAKMRAQEEAKRKQGELAGATGIRDSAVLAKLVADGIGPNTLTALVLAPIVLMVWRKGKVEPAEKNAILRAAEQRGVQPGTPDWQLIEGWLERRPREDARAAWEAYVAALREKLPPADFAKLRDDIVTRAREVARAAGGFLGVGSVSAEEKRLIELLENALR